LISGDDMSQDELLGRVDALLAGLNERYSSELSVSDLLRDFQANDSSFESDISPKLEDQLAFDWNSFTESAHDRGPGDVDEITDFDDESQDADDIDESDVGFFWYSFQQGLPKLDQDKQIDLAIQIEAGVLARGVLDGEYSRRDHWLDADLLLLADRGESARQELILGNLPLVMHWARRSSSAGMRYPIEDRFQDGVFGLMRAIEKWDYLRGYTFSTYATWDIRQQISRHTDDNAYLIRVPIHTQERWKSSRKSGTAESNQYEDARRLVMGILSWEEVLEMDYEEAVTDEDNPLLLLIDEIAMQQVIRKIFTRLPAQSSGILSARSGIGSGEPRTLDSIGTEMGITRERVRQIEAKTMSASGLAYWSSVRPFFETALDLASEGWLYGESFVGALCLDPMSTPHQILNDLNPPKELRKYKKAVLTELTQLLSGLVQIFNDLGGPFEAPPCMDEVKRAMTASGVIQQSQFKAQPVHDV